MRHLHKFDVIGERPIAPSALAIVSEWGAANRSVDEAAIAEGECAFRIASSHSDSRWCERELSHDEFGIPAHPGSINRLAGRCEPSDHRIVVNLGAHLTQDAHCLGVDAIEVLVGEWCQLQR